MRPRLTTRSTWSDHTDELPLVEGALSRPKVDRVLDAVLRAFGAVGAPFQAEVDGHGAGAAGEWFRRVWVPGTVPLFLPAVGRPPSEEEGKRGTSVGVCRWSPWSEVSDGRRPGGTGASGRSEAVQQGVDDDVGSLSGAQLRQLPGHQVHQLGQ
jgi:hypothetical protein